MATAEERLMEWLCDAHAMEEQAETMLSALSRRIENYPEFKAQVDRHLEETREQARIVRQCIERRGGDNSALKDLAGKFVATWQGVSGAFVGDEIVKAGLAAYTFEQMEIGSYTILVAAAAEVGDTQTRGACERLLDEERAMAEWLIRNLGGLTGKYLAREETPGLTAKH